jgi:hypothetical protein
LGGGGRASKAATDSRIKARFYDVDKFEDGDFR